MSANLASAVAVAAYTPPQQHPYRVDPATAALGVEEDDEFDVYDDATVQELLRRQYNLDYFGTDGQFEYQPFQPPPHPLQKQQHHQQQHHQQQQQQQQSQYYHHSNNNNNNNQVYGGMAAPQLLQHFPHPPAQEPSISRSGTFGSFESAPPVPPKDDLLYQNPYGYPREYPGRGMMTSPPPSMASPVLHNGSFYRPVPPSHQPYLHRAMTTPSIAPSRPSTSATTHAPPFANAAAQMPPAHPLPYQLPQFARGSLSSSSAPNDAAARAQEFFMTMRSPGISLHYSGMCPVDNEKSKTPTSLYFELHGTGPKKVLMLLGLMCSTPIGRGTAAALAATGEYQVCLFDNRGCGRSSISVRPYTAALLARDATKLLDHLGWDSGVHMIGFSLGGMIAQKMMLKQPERFATIAFISSYHSSLYAMPTLSDLGFFVRMFVLGDKSLLPSFVKICFPKRYLNAEFEKGAKVTNYQLIYNALKGAMNDNPERSGATKRVGNFAQLTAAIMHNIGAKELAKVRQKNPDLRMLVFAATLDKVVKYRCGVSLARILKCPLVTFHGAGHMLHIDQREQFHMLLRAHLDGISPEEALLSRSKNGTINGSVNSHTPTPSMVAHNGNGNGGCSGGERIGTIVFERNPEMITKEQAEQLAQAAILADDAMPDLNEELLFSMPADASTRQFKPVESQVQPKQQPQQQQQPQQLNVIPEQSTPEPEMPKPQPLSQPQPLPQSLPQPQPQLQQQPQSQPQPQQQPQSQPQPQQQQSVAVVVEAQPELSGVQRKASRKNSSSSSTSAAAKQMNADSLALFQQQQQLIQQQFEQLQLQMQNLEKQRLQLLEQQQALDAEDDSNGSADSETDDSEAGGTKIRWAPSVNAQAAKHQQSQSRSPQKNGAKMSLNRAPSTVQSAPKLGNSLFDPSRRITSAIKQS